MHHVTMALRLMLILRVLMLASPNSDQKCGKCTCSRRPKIQVIECKNVQLTALPRPTFFKKGIPTYINVSNNIIPNIHDNMFMNFTRMRVVQVSLINNSIQNISPNVFVNLTHLKSLDLSSNNLTTLNLKMFESLSGICHLNFTQNKIFSIPFTVNFTSLKTLTLDYNHFTSFPNFCKNDTHSYSPELQVLSFIWNIARDISPNSLNCLRKLQVLYLTGNAFLSLQNNMFASLASIQEINLSYMFTLKHVYGAPLNNTNLVRVYFRSNFMYTENTHNSLNMFEGCSSMRELHLNFNFFELTPDSVFEGLFRPLTSLEHLNMAGCFLTRVPSAVAKYLVNLQVLVLNENRIETLPDGVVDSLAKLKTFYIVQNEITTISVKTFSQEIRKHLTKIDFADNPFHCSCDLRWFVDWMKRDSKIFVPPLFNLTYQCKSPDQYTDVLLKDLTLSDSICLLDPNSKVITLTGSTMLIVFMVVGSVLYRYRWHIRYFIYMIRYKHRQEVDTKQYEYDAFVAYSTEDRHWVIRTLMPVLEDEANLKLCIHDRDFLAGKLIVDNIVESIENCRCLIIIMSNSFAESRWCQFELALIQRHVLENGQHLLVLVMLEEIDIRHVTKSIRAMLQTTTYLLWGEEEYAKKAFFNRLKMLLRKRRGGGRRLSV